MNFGNPRAPKPLKTLGVLIKIEGRRFRAREPPGSILGAKMEPKARSEAQKIDTKIYGKFGMEFHGFWVDFGGHFGSILEPFLLNFCSRFSHRFLLRKRVKMLTGSGEMRGAGQEDFRRFLDGIQHATSRLLKQWAADLIASRIPPGRAKGIDGSTGRRVDGSIGRWVDCWMGWWVDGSMGWWSDGWVALRRRLAIGSANRH